MTIDGAESLYHYKHLARTLPLQLSYNRELQRDLKIELMLQLPYFSSKSGMMQLDVAKHRAAELLDGMLERRSSVAFYPESHNPDQRLKDLDVVRISEQEGRIISESFHYLHTSRSNSEHYVLTSGLPLWSAYFCISPPGFDDKNDSLVDDYPASPGKRISFVSRAYTRDSAPRNSVSYALARILRSSHLASTSSAVLTAVDPNLGFTGSSYLALNWEPLVQLEARPYAYVAGRFQTRAQCADLVRRNPLTQVEYSRCKMLGRTIFGRKVANKRDTDVCN